MSIGSGKSGTPFETFHHHWTWRTVGSGSCCASGVFLVIINIYIMLRMNWLADDITQIWGSGDIESGGTFSATTDFRNYFYTTTEVSEFQTVWTIRTSNQGTILCILVSSVVNNQQTWSDIAGGGKPADDVTAGAESLCVNN